MNRRQFCRAALLATAAIPLPALAAPTRATLYKNPQCTCCEGYAAYLRKNGFPVSGNAIVKEDFDLFTERNGQPWFVVTTIVEDPLYLQEPFVTSSNFKKEPDGSKWRPRPCSAR